MPNSAPARHGPRTRPLKLSEAKPHRTPAPTVPGGVQGGKSSVTRSDAPAVGVGGTGPARSR